MLPREIGPKASLRSTKVFWRKEYKTLPGAPVRKELNVSHSCNDFCAAVCRVGSRRASPRPRPRPPQALAAVAAPKDRRTGAGRRDFWEVVCWVGPLRPRLLPLGAAEAPPRRGPAPSPHKPLQPPQSQRRMAGAGGGDGEAWAPAMEVTAAAAPGGGAGPEGRGEAREAEGSTCVTRFSCGSGPSRPQGGPSESPGPDPARPAWRRVAARRGPGAPTRRRWPGLQQKGGRAVSVGPPSVCRPRFVR